MHHLEWFSPSSIRTPYRPEGPPRGRSTDRITAPGRGRHGWGAAPQPCRPAIAPARAPPSRARCAAGGRGPMHRRFAFVSAIVLAIALLVVPAARGSVQNAPTAAPPPTTMTYQ